MRTNGHKLALPKWRRESAFDLYELGLGLFLFISPWLFAYARSTGKVEAWASGLAVMLISLAALIAFSEWEEWLNVLLGIWLIAAPWILGFTHTTGMHVSIGVGIVITYLALLDLYLIHYPPDAVPDRARRT